MLKAILASLFALTAYAGQNVVDTQKHLATAVRVEKEVTGVYPFIDSDSFAVTTQAGLQVFNTDGKEITGKPLPLAGQITGNAIGYVEQNVFYVSGGKLQQQHTSGTAAPSAVDIGFSTAEVKSGFHFAVSNNYIAYTKPIGMLNKEVKVVIADRGKPKAVKWTIEFKKTESKKEAYTLNALQLTDDDRLVMTYKSAVQVYKLGEPTPEIDIRGVDVMGVVPIVRNAQTGLIYSAAYKDNNFEVLVGKPAGDGIGFHVLHRFKAPLKNGNMSVNGSAKQLLIFEKKSDLVEVHKYDLRLKG